MVVGSNVHFIYHDVIHHMLNKSLIYSGYEYTTYWGTIDIKDNVFIGANTTILPNLTIGSNVVIAAGSLVNKDIPDGKSVAGVPAKIIGDVLALAEERRKYSENFPKEMRLDERLRYLWKNK